MPKMIVSIDGVVIKEVQLTKDRTTLGRRPYNDIVIDNLAVSGEHAVLQMTGNEVYLEDLNSTNGTYVNGKAVKKQLLQNNDTVEIGKYKIKYINEAASAGFEKTMVIKAGAPAGRSRAASGCARGVCAALWLKSRRAQWQHQGAVGRCCGARSATGQGGHDHRQAGRGGGGHHQAAATGFVVAHVEGANKPTLNGAPIGASPSCSRTVICWSWQAPRCSSCRPESSNTARCAHNSDLGTMGSLAKHWSRIAVTLIPLVFALLHASGVLRIGVLQRLDDIIYDARLRATMPKTLDDRIVIVDIDEKSLAEVGRWPWGRNKLAELGG
jgi:pSer/pThr/pTyr-binding forkhead associated (FHA) protein